MLSSEVFFIIMSPISTSTVSLKFKTTLAFTATLIALSDGLDELKVGSTVSIVVKLSAVVLLIPA